MCILVLLGYTLAICACIYFIIFMRLLRHISLLFALMLFVGCSTDEHTAELIDRAERIVEEHPDSALTIMRSIDPETIYGDRDMAHYRLVYSEALYHSKIDSDNDSLTRPMVEYYRYNDNHTERARAMYQHALVMFNGGKNAEALHSLLEAEKSLEHISNPRLAGLVHRSKGEIYVMEYLFGYAIEEYRAAVDYFEQAGLPDHVAFSIYQMGDISLRNRDYDFAQKQLAIAKEHAIESNNNFLLNYVLLDFAYLYANLEQYDECAEVLSQIDYVSEEDKLLYCCFMSVIASYRGDYEVAEAYIEECKKYNGEGGSMVLFAQAKLAQFQGDYETTLHKIAEIKAEEDELVIRTLNNPLLDLQVQSIEDDLEQTIKDNRHNRVVIIAISVIIIFIVIIVALVLYYRNKQYRKDIDAYISIISDFELTSSNSDYDTLHVEAINSLYCDSMDEIKKLCEVYYTHSDSPRMAIKVFEQIKTIFEGIKKDSVRLAKLEAMVNCTVDNAMTKLRELCPDLTEREYRIALYSCAGFSNRAICIIEECNIETLPKIKYRIREQIRQMQSPDLEPIIKYLSSKKLSAKKSTS